MPRMRRGKPVIPPEWQLPSVEGQCMWCGKVLGGEHAGEMLDHMEGGVYTSTFCPDCRPEYEDQGHRDLERRRLLKAGEPEENWPPRLKSRLHQRTGHQRGMGPNSPGEVEDEEGFVL